MICICGKVWRDRRDLGWERKAYLVESLGCDLGIFETCGALFAALTITLSSSFSIV